MSSKISDLTTSTIGASDYVPISRAGANYKLNLQSSIDAFTGSTNIVTLGTITSGTWSGTTIAVTKGGTGATDAAMARTNLELGTISTQNSNAIAITGGTLTGLTEPVTIGNVATTISVNPGINLGLTRTMSTGNAHGYSDVSLLAPSTYSATGSASTDIVTATGSSFTTGDLVTFSSITGGSGLSALTAYYVRQASGATFKLATTNSDATIVNFSTDITSATIGLRNGYNSFDALTYVGNSGVGIFDHYAAFQARPLFNCSSMGTNCYGFWSGPAITAGMSNTQYSHFYVADATGAGGLDYQRGIVMESLTKGTYTATIICAGASNRMLHAGPVVVGSSSYGSLDANTQLQSIPAANKRGLYISSYSLTSSNAYSAIEVSGTWNTSGTPALIKANVTDTASNASSLLLDLQVGGTSKFNVTKAGVVTSKGTATNDNAAAGNVGEYTSSLVASGSAVSLTNNTTANVTSISLTAGDWDVDGAINYIASSATVTSKVSGISSTSATMPSDGSEVYSGVQLTTASVTDGSSIGRKRISISSTTTIYLVANCSFSAGTVSAYGNITARRIR